MKAKNDFEIIVQLALKDIRIRYNNSAFGYLWMIINPLLILIALYVIFTNVMKLNLPHYQIFLLLGVIVWNFFSEATTGSINSLITSLPVLKKVKIPLYDIVLGANLASLISFVINVIVLLCMIQLSHIPLFNPIRLISVFYFILLFIIVIAVSVILCTAYLYFKDITHIWSFALFIGFWMTPIIYPETFVPEVIMRIYMLNPLARIISHLRNIIIYNYLDSFMQVIITVIIILILLVVSLLFYRKYSKKIYDLL